MRELIRLVAAVVSVAALAATLLCASGCGAAQRSAASGHHLLTYTVFRGYRSDDMFEPNYWVVVANDDGTHRKRFASGDAASVKLAWSRDGSKLAVGVDVLPGGVRIFRRDGRLLRRIRRCWFGSWSRDSRHIVIWRKRDVLRIVDVMTGREVPLGKVRGSNPAWSPDGSLIAYEFGDDIWVVHPDGSGARVLTRHGNTPVWSPDSRRFAFVRYIEDDDSGARDGIWIADRDGQHARKLNDDSSTTAVWSPDSRSVAIAHIHGVDVHQLRGHRTRRVYDTTRTSDYIHDLAWTPAHKIAFVHREGDIWTVNPDGTDARVAVHAIKAPSWSQIPSDEFVVVSHPAWYPRPMPLKAFGGTPIDRDSSPPPKDR